MFCWVTVLSNCLPNTYISALSSLYHISFLLPQVAINAETHNWLKYQECMMVECLALNGTAIPPSLRLRKHWGRGAWKWKNQRVVKCEMGNKRLCLGHELTTAVVICKEHAWAWQHFIMDWGEAHEVLPLPTIYWQLMVVGGKDVLFVSGVTTDMLLFKKHPPLPRTHFA